MARTVHDTWGVAERARRADWSDAEIPKAIAKQMRRNWLRQGAIRDGARRLRRGAGRAPQPVDPALLPIVVESAPPYAFHAAGEDDVRAVLGRLPPGSLDGLREVRLCVPRADAPSEPRVRDPFTGCLRWELVPGVFGPSPAGTYDPNTAIVRINAWIGAGAAQHPLALLMVCISLRTLVHEAAHHFDQTFRTRRHRWDVECRAKIEAWAERVEEQQASGIVLPYLRERHARAWADLASWVADHAGVPIEPTVLFDHDGRLLVGLARSVLRGDARDVTRVAFARALHRVGGNPPAGKIARLVLAKSPNDAEALAVRACILQCERRSPALAERLCRRALAADPACMAAWDVLVRGLAIREEWRQTAAASEKALSHVPPGEEAPWYIVETLAEAHFRLGDWDGVTADLARMRAFDDRDARESAHRYAVLAACWREQWEAALLQASRMLAADRARGRKLWVRAARFESAHRLGRPDQAGSFTEADLARLEKSSFTRGWAQRIREMKVAPARR